MTPLRALVAAAVAVAAVVAWFLAVGAGIDGVGMAVVLADLGHPVYAAWLAWLLAAPAVLLGCAVALRRTPWPWVLAEALHLLALVALAARAEQQVPAYAWLVLAVVLGLGLGSVVAALQAVTPGPRRRPGGADASA